MIVRGKMSTHTARLVRHLTASKPDMEMKEFVDWYSGDPSVTSLGGAMVIVTSGYMGCDVMHDVGTNEVTQD